MSIKFLTALCLATSCSVSFGQVINDGEKDDLKKCQAVATEHNRTKNVGIAPEGMTRLVTWRAACADEPTTGRGNVTALCEGKRTSAKGGGRVFFWEKSDHGKPGSGYVACDA